MKGMIIPKVTFKVRQGDEKPEGGGCPIGGKWTDVTTDDYFKGKRVVLFSLPGAFTPTCSSKQLPGFEYNYNYACDYGLWVKFSKVTSLKTVFFKIGFFRYWTGQDSKLNKLNIFKSIGYKKIPFYSFRYIRNFLSLLMLPYVVIKTYFLTK